MKKRRDLSRRLLFFLRAGLNVIRTLYENNDGELIQVLALIREINELVGKEKQLKKAA